MSNQINKEGICRILKDFRRSKRVQFHRLSLVFKNAENPESHWYSHDHLKKAIIIHYQEVKDLANKSA